MSTEKINLFDEIMSVGTLPPVVVAVGDVDIRVKRSFTGAEYAAWARNEADNEKTEALILASKGSIPVKAKRLTESAAAYVRTLLETLTVDTSAEDIAAATTAIIEQAGPVRQAVLTRLGTIAGVINDEGEMTPFLSASDETNSTSI